ncbi:MAG: hypothetical protein PHE97_07555, partial [Candidatus Omnitrophica bacterium]|nr:hypothetical protein [Candidatus Omnitrophota bacterium]
MVKREILPKAEDIFYKTVDDVKKYIARFSTETYSLDNGGNASQTSLRIKAAESLGRLPLDKNETIAIPALKAMLAIETDPAVRVTIERILAMVRNQGVFLGENYGYLDNGGTYDYQTSSTRKWLSEEEIRKLRSKIKWWLREGSKIVFTLDNFGCVITHGINRIEINMRESSHITFECQSLVLKAVLEKLGFSVFLDCGSPMKIKASHSRFRHFLFFRKKMNLESVVFLVYAIDKLLRQISSVSPTIFSDFTRYKDIVAKSIHIDFEGGGFAEELLKDQEVVQIASMIADNYLATNGRYLIEKGDIVKAQKGLCNIFLEKVLKSFSTFNSLSREGSLDNGSSIQSKTQPLIIFGQTVSASRINGQKPLDNGSWLESADIPSISLLKPTEIRAWYDQRGIFNIWVKNNPEFSYRIPGLLSFNEVPCGSFTDSLQKTIAKYGFYIQLIPASYVDVFFGTYLSVPGLSGRFKAGSFKLGVKGKEGNEQVIKLRYGPFYNVVDAFNLAFKNLLQDSSNSPKPFDNGGDKSKAIRLETANLFAETISEEDRFAEDDIKSLSLPLRRIKESFTDEIFSASTGAGRNLLRKNWREWVLPWIDPFMPENEVIDNVFDVDALLANNNTLNRLVSLAERVREIGTEAWVHIGIGGSVIPTKALVNPALSVYHNDLTRKARGQAPKVYYTGDNFSGKKVHDLIEALTTQEILFKTIYNVISKSGTTQETIGAYLLIKDALEKELKRLRELFNRYKINVQDLSDLGLTVADIVPNADEAGNERFSTERFFIFTTGFDEGTSALYQLHRKGLSDEDKKDPYKGNFFDVLPVPEGTGGRFTALTPVGLLLLAVTANSNKGQTPRSQVEEVMKGAKAALIQMLETDAADLSNTAFAAAAISHIAEYKKGKTIEIFYTYDPIFIDMGWWLNELYSESLQEYGKGINTKPLLGPQDNHMDWNGIIAGPRDKIIRFLMTDEYDESEDLRVPENSGISSKNVSSIEGFKLGRVQNISCRATASSATNPVKKDKQGNKEVLPGVLNFVQILPERTLFNIGQMFYVSQTETAVLGILNGLRSNPDAAGKYTDLTYLQYWVDGYKDNTKDSLFAEKERQIKERKPLDNGGGDTARDEALAMLKEKVYFMHKDVLDESLSGLERFKAVFLDAFYSAPIGAAPSLRDVAGAVKETNAFDQYRIKEGLPITFAFDNSIYIGEEHQNIFRIIYTFNKNFDAISVICAKQENEKFVIGLGGVRYYADENSENLDSLRQELFGETVYLANRTDLRGFLWGNPLDGAFTVVVPHSGTRLGKKSILRLWAKSMVNSGILGKYLILKPDLGTEDSDMSAIEGAVSQIARDVKNIQGKELGIYSLAATSRKLEDGKWSHSKWKVR